MLHQLFPRLRLGLLHPSARLLDDAGANDATRPGAHDATHPDTDVVADSGSHLPSGQPNTTARPCAILTADSRSDECAYTYSNTRANAGALRGANAVPDIGRANATADASTDAHARRLGHHRAERDQLLRLRPGGLRRGVRRGPLKLYV